MGSYLAKQNRMKQTSDATACFFVVITQFYAFVKNISPPIKKSD